MQDTLTKASIVERLCEDLAFPKTLAKEFVDDFFELARHFLETGNHLKLSGFGNFCLRDKNERPGRNPKTGEDIPITARRVVTFRPGSKLRHLVESYSPPKAKGRSASRLKSNTKKQSKVKEK